MASATVAARVAPPGHEGPRDRPAVGTRDVDTASGGDADRPAMTGVGDPLTEHRTPADREEAK